MRTIINVWTEGLERLLKLEASMSVGMVVDDKTRGRVYAFRSGHYSVVLCGTLYMASPLRL